MVARLERKESERKLWWRSTRRTYLIPLPIASRSTGTKNVARRASAVARWAFEKKPSHDDNTDDDEKQRQASCLDIHYPLVVLHVKIVEHEFREHHPRPQVEGVVEEKLPTAIRDTARAASPSGVKRQEKKNGKKRKERWAREARESKGCLPKYDPCPARAAIRATVVRGGPTTRSCGFDERGSGVQEKCDSKVGSRHIR